MTLEDSFALGAHGEAKEDGDRYPLSRPHREAPVTRSGGRWAGRGVADAGLEVTRSGGRWAGSVNC